MLTAASRNRPAARVNPLAAVILDVCCVLVFVAIGRSAHHHGESAGGLAVLAHLISHGSRGLFQRAIVESGSFALTQQSLATAEAAGA